MYDVVVFFFFTASGRGGGNIWVWTAHMWALNIRELVASI